MLESSETLQGCKERWFGTPGGAQSSKVWREKLGASPLWVSALVTLCRAEHVLLLIHRAGSLWIKNSNSWGILVGLGSSAEGCFSSCCGVLGKDPGTLDLWHPGGENHCFSCQLCWHPTLLRSSWLSSGVILFTSCKVFFFYLAEAGNKFQGCQGKRLLLRLAETSSYEFFRTPPDEI